MTAVAMLFYHAIPMRAPCVHLHCACDCHDAPKVMTWMWTLEDLKKGGTQPTNVIVRWNGMSAKAHQITGGKRVALLNVLESYPDNARQHLLNHVALLGFDDSCLSDDMLASKKVLPGYQFRTTGTSNKPWLGRKKVSEQSLGLATHKACANHAAKPHSLRMKMTRSDWEDFAMVSAVVTNLAKDLLHICMYVCMYVCM
jgi:hypothetical protein